MWQELGLVADSDHAAGVFSTGWEESELDHSVMLVGYGYALTPEHNKPLARTD